MAFQLRSSFARTLSRHSLLTPVSAYSRRWLISRFGSSAFQPELIGDPTQKVSSPELGLPEMRIEDDCLVATINNEEVWVPHISRSIEWALPSPVDLHLFDESPVIKETI
mmetsp:Transcript_36880/g.72415  ORF Transcript_36880/g.72415 Transcript_36880/m.72415 type:complete len:110 (+) Transcript_36880:66-395(+)